MYQFYCDSAIIIINVHKTYKSDFFEAFFQFSSDKMILCNNNNQTCFSDTLTLAIPVGGCSTSPSGVQQMLMHRTTCLIPILRHKLSETIIWALSQEHLSSRLQTRPSGYKTFSCSTQLSMKFQRLIKTKLLKNKKKPVLLSNS